jgi:hypothetical protein
MNIKFLPVLILLVCSISFAQRAKIEIEAVTPHQLGSSGLTTDAVASGLHVVGNLTYVYLSPKNIGNTQPITNAQFEFVSKPASSSAAFETSIDDWVQFKPDIKGEYKVKLTITTSGGTDDTTISLYSANYVGVGNFNGIPATFPNCMTCHQNTPKFQDIFSRWEVSGHANLFNYEITHGAAYYSTSCMKCHTVGYDHNIEANNGGFDDVAEQLGWVWQGPPNAGKWDSLKTEFPGLVNFATIGCENCHGPGGEHAFGGNPNKIAISEAAGVCAQCHDEPWRHNKYSEYENSLHSEALWSSSFAQGSSSQNNSLGNCIRCHDAKGYVNFTKGQTTNTTGMIEADHESITCAACHDPHGNENVASLRFTPAGSDTLGNGYQYTEGGVGQVCMNCHKARRNNVAYTSTPPNSSHWGPHHSVQADVLLGQNAAAFDATPFLSSPHKYAIQDACVTCHMAATTDTGTVTRDKVGGHSFTLHNEENDYYHSKACVNCHGQKENWDEFLAKGDFDGNGTVESIPAEIAGLEKALRIQLPPVGVDSISWEMIRDANDPNLTKAYFNYQLIAYDGSKGMHNTMFAVDVLQKSIVAAGGTISNVITDNSLLPEEYSVTQNYPNPFNPSTTIKFSLPYESSVKINIYSITGEMIRELVNDVRQAGDHQAIFNTMSLGRDLASGVYFYTIEANSLNGNKSFRESKKMILMK